MAFFNKNKQQTQIPELQEYYATQNNKESAGMAWLLAGVSLLVTIGLFVGIFFGGRYVYRRFNKSTDTTTVQTATTDTSTTTSTNSDNSGSVKSTEKVTVPETSNGVGAGVAKKQTTSQNENAIAAVTDIPNTGAGSTALYVFATTFFVAVCAYRYAIVRNNK